MLAVIIFIQNVIEFYIWLNVVTAAECCSTVDEALTLLASKRQCPCCLDSFMANKMITLNNCQHEMCRECMVNHFTVRIREHPSVYDVTCPLGGCSDDMQQKLDNDYFVMLSNQLQVLLDKEVYDLFQTKLRDQIALKNEPFVFCSKCPNGFIYSSGLEGVTCPECKHVMCPKCRVEWEPNHKGRSCDEAIKNSKDDKQLAKNDSEKWIKNTLDENGIQCPKCKFRFELTLGGCMHFTCTQCKHEFCEGCSLEMFKNGQCNVFVDCNAHGLHAHHPRNCLYYLRDNSVAQLELLLQMSKVVIPASKFNTHTGRCQLLQVGASGIERPCGSVSSRTHKGLCEQHYKEHLTLCINSLQLDPALIMDAAELEVELRRNRKEVPAKLDRETEYAYKKRLLQAVTSGLPLMAIVTNDGTNISFTRDLEHSNPLPLLQEQCIWTVISLFVIILLCSLYYVIEYCCDGHWCLPDFTAWIN